MGCGHSRGGDARPGPGAVAFAGVPSADAPTALVHERRQPQPLTKRRRNGKKGKRVPVGSLLDDPAAAIDLEYLTPMLLIPFIFFVQLGRIPKSTKPWREEALHKGWLVEYRKDDGKTIIFISHTWWDREFLDPARDPSEPGLGV